MIVTEIAMDVEADDPKELPRLGETFMLSIMRMDEPAEFVVSKTDVKRRWVNEAGDDEGYVYGGEIVLELVYEDDEDDDGDGDAEPSEPVESGGERA